MATSREKRGSPAPPGDHWEDLLLHSGSKNDAVWSTIGVDFVESQLQRNPSDPHSWLMFAHSCLTRGDLAKAREAIEKVLVLDSRHELNNVALGGLFYSLALKAGEMDDWALLLDAARRADELGFTQSMTQGQETALLFQKARAFVVGQRYQDAIDALKVSTDINQFQPHAFTLLGHAHYQAGEWRDAREAYVKALRLGANDPLIAQFVEVIESYFPHEMENGLPQKLDPYIRAAISFVEDQWLGLSLEQASVEERETFDETILHQMIAQSGEIRWGGRETVLLRVPVMKLGSSIGETFIGGRDEDANPTVQQYHSAIRKVLDYFMETQAVSQERACSLNQSVIHKMKRGRRLLNVTFRPITKPYFIANLHFVFEKPLEGDLERSQPKEEGEKSLNWKNSFEFIFKNARHKIPFENVKSFFARDEAGKDPFSSLAKIREHFLANDCVYFIHQMAPGRISSTKILLGTECITLLRDGGRLRGIRLVLGADVGIKGRGRFYIIFFASFEGGEVQQFTVDLTPQVMPVNGKTTNDGGSV